MKHYITFKSYLEESLAKEQLRFKKRRLAKKLKRKDQIISDTSSPETTAETGERMETIGSPFFQEKV